VKSNRDAIGAHVRVKAGTAVQTRMVRTGSSYLSQSELPLSFGLGSRAAADRVVVEWPSGARDELKAVPTGQSIVITEGRGATDRQPLGRAAPPSH
jgi:hypothetical protein